MNIKRTIAAVIRAPLLAGDSIPNMANTGWVGGWGQREGYKLIGCCICFNTDSPIMIMTILNICIPDPRQTTSIVGYLGGLNTSP